MLKYGPNNQFLCLMQCAKLAKDTHRTYRCCRRKARSMFGPSSRSLMPAGCADT